MSRKQQAIDSLTDEELAIFEILFDKVNTRGLALSKFENKVYRALNKMVKIRYEILNTGKY
jgi:hypothetical protein